MQTIRSAALQKTIGGADLGGHRNHTLVRTPSSIRSAALQVARREGHGLFLGQLAIDEELEEEVAFVVPHYKAGGFAVVHHLFVVPHYKSRYALVGWPASHMSVFVVPHYKAGGQGFERDVPDS